MSGGATRRRVTDFVWRDGEPWAESAPAAAMEELGALWGQFGLHLRDGEGGHLLARDRLGVNKLFFSVTDAGEVVSSSYLADLLERGHPLRQVWSVPSGHAVWAAPARGEYRLFKHAALSYESGEGDPDAVAANIRRALSTTFERLAAALRGRPIFVTLSGGLDSTVVAVMAREHLGPFTAVTFAMEGDEERGDLAFARIVAAALGVELEVVRASADDLVGLLDTVLVHGQDWRDFNVHCGLVNAAIGRHLQGRTGDRRPVILTGDGMNELMADYCPVVYRGVEYYGLPRLPVERLRRFLVAGLDSGDREVGIFNAFGLDTLQPYALTAEAYAAVPGEWLAAPAAKQALVRRVMGARVPEPIYARPKVRAQVGSSEQVGGTLAALADRGLNAAALRTRLAALLAVDEGELTGFVRGGIYRFTAEPPWGGKPA